jgi:uncharacterized DUF497 family protein
VFSAADPKRTGYPWEIFSICVIRCTGPGDAVKSASRKSLVMTLLGRRSVALAERALRHSRFRDPLSATGADPDHSLGEERFVPFGLSTAGRLLVVAHTDRDDTIRIISARPVTPSERKIYEERPPEAE